VWLIYQHLKLAIFIVEFSLTALLLVALFFHFFLFPVREKRKEEGGRKKELREELCSPPLLSLSIPVYPFFLSLSYAPPVGGIIPKRDNGGRIIAYILKLIF
jgi:hypothetical protein